MLALRLFGEKDIRLVETERPAIAAGDLLLKVEAAAICGTDVRMWQNGAAGVDAGHPLTLGHEFAGTIVEAGSDVSYYKPGMRVCMQPNTGCGICDMCVSGRSHLCEHYRAFGINMDGAMAEYVAIPSEAVRQGNLMLVPENLTCEEAAVCEPLSCAYHGFTKCFVQPGEYALVMGAGPLGVMHAQLLHMARATVLMSDLSADRLTQCRASMPYVTTYCGDDLKGFVMEQTAGRGLDVAITACPVPAVQAAMLPLMNYDGRVNFFGGVPASQQPVPIDTNLAHYRGLYLTGSTRSSIAQFRQVVRFASQGLIDVRSSITHRYHLGDALSAFENAKNAVGIKYMLIF